MSRRETGEGGGEGDFKRLQEAHDRLIEAYVDAHNKARGFWVRPVVDGHLRKGTESLRNTYIQARETRFRSQEPRRWLDAEIKTLEELKPTFDREWGVGSWLTGISTVFGLPGLTSALTATGVSVGALAILRACLCHMVVLVPLIVSFALFLTFGLGFSGKRELFLNTPADTEGGIYALEDDAFATLGETKSQERPLDVGGWALATLAWAVAAIVGKSAIEKGLFVNDAFVVVYIFTAVAAVATVLAYLYSRQRAFR